jgi:hypothetical protein
MVAVGLYRRLNVTLTFRDAVVTGLLAGVWHGLFGLVLSPLGLAGAGGLLRELQPLMSGQDWSEMAAALTGTRGLLFNLFGVAVDLIFGLLGGLIGNAIFGSRRAIAS